MSDAARLRSRMRGALLGAAVGDALGAPFEGSGGGTLPETVRLMAYTDDTHMTLATARSLLACRGFDSAHLAKTFAEHYEAEPWRGYGPGPPRIFSLLRRGVPWEQASLEIYPGGSFGNGGAMRVVPVALVAGPDLEAVDRWARESARITHAHELGMDGAALQACAVASLVHGPTDAPLRRERLLLALRHRARTDVFREALDRVAGLPRDLDAFQVASTLGCGIEAARSVPTALYAFLRSPEDFEVVVSFAIALGGDTDTIASMAGALCGAHLGEEAIPKRWLEALEDALEIGSLADDLLGLAQDPSRAANAASGSVP